jgi:hypothetical protein
MRQAKKQKPWGKMTAAELAAATRQFDRPIRFEDTRPMSATNRKRWERSQRAGARGGKVIQSLNLDPKLLVEAQAYAKRKKLTWAQLLERGLRRELAVKD